MASVLESLRSDHENIRMLLDILDTQISIFYAGQSPNVLLIEDIVDYMRGYPALCHHPREDLVYDKLRRKASPQLLERIGDLRAEHDELAMLTTTFMSAVDNVLPDPCEPRTRFVALAREFLDRYRRHLELEETVLFPAALEHLGGEEWAEIDRRLVEHKDPLFGEKLERRFANLHHAIVAVAYGPQ